MILTLENFERHGLLVRLIRIFTVPLLNVLPSETVRYFMRLSSHDAATVIAHGGSTNALEIMYTRYHRKLFSRGFLQGSADLFWHHVVSQPKALRNRLRIVEHLVSRFLDQHSSHERTDGLAILSIAGGSARAVIQAVHERKKHKGFPKLSVVTLDRDERALILGRKLALSLGVAEIFSWVRGDVRTFKEISPTNRYDLIEMVGLLDYFSNERAHTLLTEIRSRLKPGGRLITANIRPNSEIAFIQKTGWPQMYYRTPTDLCILLAEAGFPKDGMIFYDEPLDVHAVVEAHALCP